MMIWCPIHGSHEETIVTHPPKCSFCAEALVQARAAIRVQNASTTIGRCGFCGGPSPCLKEG
jgi:hypothetical protein